MSRDGLGSNLSGIAILGAVIIGAIILANTLLAGDIRKLLTWAAILVLPLCFIYWKQTLLLIPIWILAEGMVRKHMIPSVNVLFFKDAALLLVYFRLLLDHLSTGRSILMRTPITFPVLLLFAWYLFQLFNPELPSLLMGLVGIKVIFFYVPYFFLVRFLFKDKDSILKYLKVFLMIAIPIAAIGYYQFITGSDPGAFDPPVFDGKSGDKIIRPSATFYYNSYFGQYAFLTFFIILSVVNIKYFNRRRFFLISVLVANMVSLMISGQRTAWVAILAQISFMLILSPALPKKYSVIPRLILFGAIALAIVLTTMPKTYESFETRMEHTINDPESSGYIFTYRMERLSIRAIFKNRPWLGHGSGTATPAARHLGQFIPAVEEHTSSTEGGYVQMWWEIGLFGMLIFWLLLIRLLKYTLHIRRTLKNDDLKQLALLGILVCSGYMISNISVGMMNTSSTAILFWFLLGICPTLKELDKTLNTSETNEPNIDSKVI